MEGDHTRIALIDDIDPVADVIERLGEMGFKDDDLTILSGQPHTERAMGRPELKTTVPLIGMTGFFVGLGMAVALVWGTPWQYPLVVGGQPIMPVPPLLVLGFEFSMLGLMVGAFLGVLWDSEFWSFSPKIYHPGVSDGKTALIFKCGPERYEKIQETLSDIYIDWVDPAEAKTV